jgi:hypothetical protein
MNWLKIRSRIELLWYIKDSSAARRILGLIDVHYQADLAIGGNIRVNGLKPAAMHRIYVVK